MTPLNLTADWHLDRAAWARHPEATGDSVYALRQIVRIANRLDGPLVVAGDVFDTADPDSATVHAAVDELAPFHGPVYFVQGQHERAAPPWLLLSPHAVHLHARRIHLRDGPLLAGWDYCADLQEAREFLLQGQIDLFVTHQVFAEAMNSAVRSTGKVADLPSTVARVVSGDYHEHRTTVHPRPGLPPVELVSPGSTHFRAVNEPPPKAFYHMRADGRLESVPLDTRPVRQWVIRADADLVALVAQSDLDLFGPSPGTRPAELNRPVVQVRVARTVADAADRLRARFPQAHLHVAPLADREGSERAADPAPAVRPGAAGVLEHCLSRLPLSARLAADARAVLTAADPADAVGALYRQLTEEPPCG